MMQSPEAPSGRSVVLLLAVAVFAFATLVSLGIWQVQRLQWKEALIADIDQRIASEPRPLDEIEKLAREAGDVDYWPVEVRGQFVHSGESFFLATHGGRSGWYVYTPLQMADHRFVFVNRGFVPYDRRDASTRTEGQVAGETAVKGLARSAPSLKPSAIVPDNDPATGIFHWKDLAAMAKRADLPANAEVLPFFVDANAAPNPGGLPVGGVTIVRLPNSHLQYAVTWFGLALALAGVVGVWLWGRRKAG
jgi:surfeit locus 1 family protein